MPWHEGVLAVITIMLAVFAAHQQGVIEKMEVDHAEQELRDETPDDADDLAGVMEHPRILWMPDERSDFTVAALDPGAGDPSAIMLVSSPRLPAPYVELLQAMSAPGEAHGWGTKRMASQLGSRESHRAVGVLVERGLLRPCTVHSREWFITDRGRAVATIAKEKA